MKVRFFSTLLFLTIGIVCLFSQGTVKSVVAVLDFEVIGISDNELGKAITEQFNSMLATTNRFIVVERPQLGKLSDEHKLNLTGMVDMQTAVEIGRLIGAKILVMGSISKIGNMYTIVSRFVECGTGEIIMSKTARTEDLSSLPETIEFMVSALMDSDVSEKNKNERNPKTAFSYSLLLPGLGQAYAKCSTKRVAAFAAGACFCWISSVMFYSESGRDKKNADYLFSVDPTGKDVNYVLYDDSDDKNYTASEWRNKQNEDRNMAVFTAVFACGVHIWAALDASSQAQKHNKERGIHISANPFRNEVRMVFT